MRAIAAKISSSISAITKWDKIGIGLSLICAFHCIFTPVLMIFLPIMGRYYLAHPFFHLILALLILPVGLFSFWQGFRHHRNIRVFLFGIPGLLLVVFIPYLVHKQNFKLDETKWMILGSGFLVVAHLLNRWSCACKTHHH